MGRDDEIRIQDDVEGHDLRREGDLSKDEDTAGHSPSSRPGVKGPLHGDDAVHIQDDVEGHVNNRPLDHDTSVNNRPLDNPGF